MTYSSQDYVRHSSIWLHSDSACLWLEEERLEDEVQIFLHGNEFNVLILGSVAETVEGIGGLQDHGSACGFGIRRIVAIWA